jgi:predicted Zn-dependent protease
MTTGALRLLIAALAVVVCAWFALGVRQAHDLAQATRIIAAGNLDPVHARQASGLLDGAATLDPDSTVEIMRGYLHLEQGDLPGARKVLLPVVHDEPQNIAAWLALARASLGDLKVGEAAYSALARLRPAVR